jgi:phage host-nuclease inhibitor protein Gam
LPRQRAKKDSVKLPQSIEEVDGMVAQIGELQREVQSIEISMNQQIEAIKVQCGSQADLRKQAIAELMKSIQPYMEVNRDNLTDGGKTKTVKLRSGTISWRLTPKAVTVRGVEQVISRFKQLGLTQYLRVKTEIDKQSILANPDQALAVEGVKLTQREEFVVTPSESQAEVVKKGRTL